MTQVVRVVLEKGKSRVFLRALEWPGWCRSGKSEELAKEGMLSHAVRYALVAENAQIAFPARPEFEVVERSTGNATTDFGAPSAVAQSDHETLSGKDMTRWTSLLQACWKQLDDTAARSEELLLKGPRGGGRDRTKMLQHVVDAERIYASKMGIALLKASADRPATVAANRRALNEALNGVRQTAAWPVRYGIHRTAWHVLDHAWEMQDRQPAQ